MKFLWQCIKKSLWLYLRYFFGIFLIMLPLFILDISIGVGNLYYVEKNANSIIPHMLTISFLLMWPIFQGTLIYYIAGKFAGYRVNESLQKESKQSILKCFRQSLCIYIPLLIFYTLWFVSFGLGLLLLIIPGVILFIRLIFGDFYVALEKASGSNAYHYSFNNTGRYQWLLLFGTFSMLFFLSAPILLIKWLLMHIVEPNILVNIFLDALFGFTMPLITIFAFCVYSHHKEMVSQGLEQDIR